MTCRSSVTLRKTSSRGGNRGESDIMLNSKSYCGPLCNKSVGPLRDIG